MVYAGKYMSEDPARDAERYYEELEADYAIRNGKAVCDCCGQPCGAEEHYDVFGRTACSRECARKLLTQDDVDDIIDEWLDDNTVAAE